MRTRFLMMLSLATALVVGSAAPGTTLMAAANKFVGTWEGSMEVKDSKGHVTKDPARLVLKDDGGKLTGTAGDTSDHQYPIQDAVVSGDTVKFHITFGPTIHFDLHEANGVITGNVKVDSAGSVDTGTISLKRK